jgi:hypothetical protein
VIETPGRRFRNAEFAAREQPTVPANHLVVAIDQDRDIKVESSDAVGDLPDLLLAMAPRVRRVKL